MLGTLSNTNSSAADQLTTRIGKLSTSVSFAYFVIFHTLIDLYFTAKVPDECCKGEVTDGCANGVIDMDEQQAETKIYTQGCLTKFETFIQDNVGAAAGTGVGLIVLLFIGILVSCCVAKSMREKQLYV